MRSPSRKTLVASGISTQRSMSKSMPSTASPAQGESIDGRDQLGRPEVIAHEHERGALNELLRLEQRGAVRLLVLVIAHEANVEIELVAGQAALEHVAHVADDDHDLVDACPLEVPDGPHDQRNPATRLSGLGKLRPLTSRSPLPAAKMIALLMRLP